MDFFLTIDGYFFKHLGDVVFDRLLGVIYFWLVSAKCERIYLNEYQSTSDLITDMDDYIEFYNHQRFHETLKYKKPMDV
jgi:hypothetical protein